MAGPVRCSGCPNCFMSQYDYQRGGWQSPQHVTRPPAERPWDHARDNAAARHRNHGRAGIRAGPGAAARPWRELGLGLERWPDQAAAAGRACGGVHNRLAWAGLTRGWAQAADLPSLPASARAWACRFMLADLTRRYRSAELSHIQETLSALTGETSTDNPEGCGA